MTVFGIKLGVEVTAGCSSETEVDAGKRFKRGQEVQKLLYSEIVADVEK